MDFHFNHDQGADPVLDFHRFVLLLNHSFTSRLRFVGELEVEHALVEGLEEKGELEVEQAYIDFLLSRSVNVRAGMLLVPVGIINERHEPPVFNGVERPFVDTVMVRRRGSTSVSACMAKSAMASATARMPWRHSMPWSSRRRTAFAKANRRAPRPPSGTWRSRPAASMLGIRDLTVGASIWTGESSFAVARLDTTVRVLEADARYQRG